MTSPKAEPVTSSLLPRLGSIMLAVVFLAQAAGSAPASAQSASPEAGTAKSEAQAKRPRPAMAGQPNKPAGAKAKPRAHGKVKAAKPAGESTAQPSPDAEEKAPPTPSVGTSETVNFDSEADDQKMEPGYELIQAAPRRAHHRSLVPASPSPEDSVVNRQ